MAFVAPAPLWTSVAARVVGAWILAGCLLKALLGTPGDLPPLVQKAPLPLGVVFALVLGIEAFVAVGLLLRPGRFWPLGLLLLLAFGAVLASQVAAGATSCGCFGGTIDVPPWVMLAADALFLVLLLAARPWRLARGGRVDLLVAALALAAGVALPWLTDREAKPGQTGPRLGPAWVRLDVRSWVGKPIRETELARWADLSAGMDGVWLLYRDSCEVCARCLENLTMSEQRGAQELTLVRLREPGDATHAPAVHVVPEGPWVHRIDLPDHIEWTLQAPGRLVVQDGIVRSAEEGVEADTCR